MQANDPDRDVTLENHKYIERLTGKRVGADVIHYGTIDAAVNKKIDEGFKSYEANQNQETQNLGDEAEIAALREQLN